MRLQNLLSLTGAALESEPAVTQIESIIFHPAKIRRGDLFVAYETSMIPEAVAAGAYAILYEGDVVVTDPEIAWLKAKSIEFALLRLLRFHLLEKSLNTVCCDRVTLAIAAQMIKDPRCYVLDTALRYAFDDLWSLPEHSWVFLPESEKYKDLFVNCLPLPHQNSMQVEIAEQTLFETSFVLDGVFYDRMQLSPFFLPYLVPLYAFAKKKELAFTIAGMQGSRHFVPVFVGEDLQVKTFGQGGKVLIFEPDLTLLLQEVSFIREQAKWAKIIYLVPEGSFAPESESETFLSYTNQEAIMQILKTVPFHFVLIGGQDRSLLESMAARSDTPTLF